MAPSQQSQALVELFNTFAANFPQDGNLFLERCVYDQVYKAGAEANGVSMSSVDVAGRPAIWFTPDGASTKHAILYMHGGGFSFGSPGGHRKLTAHLAKACNCLALSIDYRLTPEHKYPAALDDCVAAYKYLLDMGLEPKHIVVAGDSCGGGLSTCVPLAAVERGLPAPGASVSLSPLYDLTTQDGGTMDTNEKNDVLNTKPFCKMLADRYVEGSGASKDNPLISALFMTDEQVKKLPPHWISIGGYDMLRDHGERMAEKLKKAGVEVEVEIHEGLQHVMEFMVGRAPEADSSIEHIGKWVRKTVGNEPS